LVKGVKTYFFGFKYPEGFKHRYMPKKEEGGIWSVIDSTDLVQIDEELFFKLNTGPEAKTVAAQEINTSEDVRRWYLEDIVNMNEFVRLPSAGTSALGRNLPVLDIYDGNPKDKDVIVLLTRQHPPEVTGYFAFQNILKTIVTKTDLSMSF